MSLISINLKVRNKPVSPQKSNDFLFNRIALSEALTQIAKDIQTDIAIMEASTTNFERSKSNTIELQDKSEYPTTRFHSIKYIRSVYDQLIHFQEQLNALEKETMQLARLPIIKNSVELLPGQISSNDDVKLKYLAMFRAVNFDFAEFKELLNQWTAQAKFSKLLISTPKNYNLTTPQSKRLSASKREKEKSVSGSANRTPSPSVNVVSDSSVSQKSLAKHNVEFGNLLQRVQQYSASQRKISDDEKSQVPEFKINSLIGHKSSCESFNDSLMYQEIMNLIDNKIKFLIKGYSPEQKSEAKYAQKFRNILELKFEKAYSHADFSDKFALYLEAANEVVNPKTLFRFFCCAPTLEVENIHPEIQLLKLITEINKEKLVLAANQERSDYIKNLSAEMNNIIPEKKSLLKVSLNRYSSRA